MNKAFILIELFSLFFLIFSQVTDICLGEKKDGCRHKDPKTAPNQCCWVKGIYQGNQIEICLPFEKDLLWEEIEKIAQDMGYEGDLKITCNSKRILIGISMLFLIILL